MGSIAYLDLHEYNLVLIVLFCIWYFVIWTYNESGFLPISLVKITGLYRLGKVEDKNVT